MLKELLGIFEISVGSFMRNGCHVGLVGLIRRGLKTKLHTCLKSRILILYIHFYYIIFIILNHYQVWEMTSYHTCT